MPKYVVETVNQEKKHIRLLPVNVAVENKEVNLANG